MKRSLHEACWNWLYSSDEGKALRRSCPRWRPSAAGQCSWHYSGQQTANWPDRTQSWAGSTRDRHRRVCVGRPGQKRDTTVTLNVPNAPKSVVTFLRTWQKMSEASEDEKLPMMIRASLVWNRPIHFHNFKTIFFFFFFFYFWIKNWIPVRNERITAVISDCYLSFWQGLHLHWGEIKMELLCQTSSSSLMIIIFEKDEQKWNEWGIVMQGFRGDDTLLGACLTVRWSRLM